MTIHNTQHNANNNATIHNHNHTNNGALLW